jgi:methylamine dehydrogenase heavy chain
MPLKVASTMVGVTQDASPLMFTTDDNGDFFISDARTGKLLRTMKGLGTSLIFTVAPGEG